MRKVFKMKKNIKEIIKAISIIAAALAIAASTATSMASCKNDGEGEGSGSESESASETPAASESESETPEVPEFDFMSEDLTKYIILGDYKGMEVKIPAKTELTDDDVQLQIDYDLIGSKIYNEVTDRAVTKNDIVYISYKGLMDGEEFEGGTGTKDMFTIFNGGGFIDGFADGIIGAMPGKEVAVELKFPEDYYEELAGKPVTFMVTVKHIYEAKELTDEVIKELTGKDDYTADKLKEEYRTLMQEQIDAQYDEYKIAATWEKIIDNITEIELPRDLVEGYYNMDVEYYKTYAALYGMTYEQMLDYVGMTDDELYARAHDNVLGDMVVYSIVKAENITITDEEYSERLKELTEGSDYSEEDYLKAYGKEKLMEMFTYTKTYEEAIKWQNFVVAEDAE